MSELFRIETERLVFVWGAGNGHRPTSTGRTDAPTRLSEQTEYTLFLRSSTGELAELVHRDPTLLRGLRTADDGQVVHGTLNFGSQVGRSRFGLRVGGELEHEFEVEVFPSKLDYEQDYTQLSAETQEILTGLVLEYLRSTFHPGRGERTVQASHLEWLTLLRHAADDLERALDRIARHPRWGLDRNPQTTRAERVRRPDATLRRSVLRGAGTGEQVDLTRGVSVREQVPEHRARPTLDTPEHRWLATQLGQILRRLAQLRQTEASLPPSLRRQRIVEEVATLEGRVARWLRSEPLLAAGAEPQPGFASLQLLQAPGYREAYRACLTLALGLHLEGGPVRLAVKDLHLLYEYWCYLMLAKLLASEADCPQPASQLLGVERNGLRVLLQRGWEHTVRFTLPDGRNVALTYNPRFGGDPLLVPQQPDLLLEIGTRRLVLDAKYRLDTSPEYLRRYGGPGPPEDALNGLHRYRDALKVSQAVALFPYHESEPGSFGASRLHRSVERIGIGALPFLPRETDYVAGWLRKVLAGDK